MICPVVPYPEIGGSHKRTMRLLEAIEAAGIVPHLVTTDGRDEAGVAALRARGWSLDVVPDAEVSVRRRARQHLRRLPSPYLEGVAARVRELVEEGCAFVQVEHTQSAYYGRSIGKAPWVLSLHNVDSQLMRSVVRAQRPSREWLSSLNRWLALQSVERRSLSGADVVLCVSDEDRRVFEARARRVIVVPNGVDDQFFEVPSELPHGRTALFFGQFDYLPNALGIERFLREAWPSVASSCPSANLRLVGRGMTGRLRALAESSARVEVVGFAEDLTAELAAARVVLVPIWAGGGTRLKVLESLAAARPVVGTEVGVEGIGFKSGVHGEVANDPSELARRTVDLLDDDERAARVAAAGRELAESFRWKHATRPAEQLYRRLAAR